MIAEKLLTEFEADREISKEQHLSSVERIDPATQARMEGYHIISAKLSDHVGGVSIRAHVKTIHAARTLHRAECGRTTSGATSEHRFEGFTVEKFREWGHIPYSYKERRERPEALTICARCTKVVAALPEGWGEVVKAEELAAQTGADRQGARVQRAHDPAPSLRHGADLMRVAVAVGRAVEAGLAGIGALALVVGAALWWRVVR